MSELASGSEPPALRILHVDMDAFYAAVEVHDDPRLAGRPLIVGGTGRRGVVAACSYEARTFGVHSAMPTAQARRLCPHATYLPGRFDRYREVSAALHRIFDRYTPLVEPIALDEAFLDVGGAQRLLGPAPELAARIRREVATELGLAASVGVATTKFLAKLASEAAKPTVGPRGPGPGRGVVVVAPGEELSFLHPLPVEALWGVGPATAARLRRLGVGTVGQLAQVPPEALEAAVGRAVGRHLHQLSLGVDPRPVEPTRAPKSIGHEETWAYDRYDRADLGVQLLRMADAVSARLRAAGLAGRTVTVKVRYGDFTTMTRSQTVGRGVDTAPELSRLGGELLDRVDVSPGVRLLGLSVSALAPVAEGEGARRDPVQLRLSLEGGGPAPGGAGDSARRLAGGRARGREGFPAPRPADDPSPGEPEPGWAAAADAIDAVRHRFGDRAVGPAALVGRDGLSLKRQGDTQWGPHAEDDGRDPNQHES